MYNRNNLSSKPKGYFILTFFILGCILSHLIDGSSNNPDILENDYHKIPQSRFSNDEDDVVSPDDSYYCQDGTRIESSSYCDGIVDCPKYAEDERNCKTCAEGYYRCNDGLCINETLICDGKIDCYVYEDDEKDCEKVARCAKTKAKCYCSINFDTLENEIRCYGENMIFLPNKINPAITSFNLKDNKLGLLGGLTHYTFSRYQHIIKLYLDDNEIEQLDSKIFENLTNLKILSLSNNRIATLDRDIFKNLLKLEELNLNSNYITKLHVETFSNQNYLLGLRLDSNKIEMVEDLTFYNLTNLKYLNFRHNSIASLSSHIFSNLSRLQILELQFNYIQIIANETFASMENLNALNLSFNRILVLRSNMFKSMKQLEELRLNSNEVDTIEINAFSGLKKLQKLYLNENDIKELTAYMFHEMNDLKELALQSNVIHTIEEHTFEGLQNVEILDLNDNRIKAITSNMFQPFVNLISLNLNENNISIIEDLPFKKLKILNDLYLGSNDIKILRSHTFVGLEYLKQLELQQNKIETVDSGTFEDLIRLRTLNLSFNKIKTFTSSTFSGLSQLELLCLQNNEIATIEMHPFYKLKKLIALNLSNNRIIRLEALIFDGLYNLRELLLQNSRIKIINRFGFRGLRSLKILNLRHNEIEEVHARIFENTPLLEHLLTDEHRFCCMKKNLTTCMPPPDQFSSCNDLMANNVLRISIWIQGIIAIVANLFVIIFRSGNRNSNLNKVNSFLIKNLALSDLFMGVYLLLIAITDYHYRGEYYLHDFKWRMSLKCNFAGFISTFSSELTVFTLTVITIDRLFSITFPFRIQQQEINRTRVLMAIVWVLAAVLASIPLPFFHIDYFNNFYGRSGVCLALHITNQKANGWQYSVFVFIILNAISFIIITLSYISMYWLAKQSRKVVNASTHTSQTSMAFRMTLLVLTDAACWIPIIILGVTSLIGYTVSSNVYAWIAVFVLPLNAALNPILYTISTIPLMTKFKKISRFNGQIKFKWPRYRQRCYDNVTSFKPEEKGQRL